MRDPAACIQREHASRNALEYGFNVPGTLLESHVRRAQLAAGGLDLQSAGFQLFCHSIERAHQIANLIGSADFNAVIESSARNFLGSFSQCRHRTRDQLGKKQRQPGGGEEHHHRQQKQHAHVSAPNGLAAAAKLQIPLLTDFGLSYSFGKFLRQRHSHHD